MKMSKLKSYFRGIWVAISDPNYHNRKLQEMKKIYDNDIRVHLKDLQNEAILKVQRIINNSEMNGFLVKGEIGPKFTVVKSGTLNTKCI